MNAKKVTLILVVVILALLTGCANQKELGVENPWRHKYTKEHGIWSTDAEIVFEPGDKCTMTIFEETVMGFAYTILVKDDTYDNYMVAIGTLDEGYTIADLNAYPNDRAYAQPDFLRLISFHVVDPGSTTFLGDSVQIEEGGDYYITCQVQGEDGWKIIGHQGPIHIKPVYKLSSD